MPAINLPSSINQASWSKKAGEHDKSSQIGNLLKDLAKAHKDLDLSAGDGKFATMEEAEAAEAKLEAIGKKQFTDLCNTAQKLQSAANGKAKDKVPKEVQALASTIAKEAGSYLQQAEKAYDDAMGAIEKRMEALAAEAKKKGGAKKGEEEEDDTDKLANEKDEKKFKENLKKTIKGWLTKLQAQSKSMKPDQLKALRAGEGKVGMAKFRMQVLGKKVGIVIGRNNGEGERKIALRVAGVPGGAKDSKGFVYYDPDRKLYVFEGANVVAGAGPSNLLKMSLKTIIGFGPKLCLQKPGQKGEESEGPDETDPEAQGEAGAAEAKGENVPEAPPQSKAATGVPDEVRAFAEEAGKRLQAIAGKLQSLNPKSLEEVKKLRDVISAKGRDVATLNEAKSALNRIVVLADSPQAAGAGASPALVQAQSAWSTDVSNFRNGIRDMLSLLDDAYSGEPEQKAAVDNAKKMLGDAAGKVGDQLDLLLRAMLKGSDAQRTQLSSRVRDEVNSVRNTLTSDKILSALDKNELNKSLNVVAPMQQRLQAIEAALR